MTIIVCERQEVIDFLRSKQCGEARNGEMCRDTIGSDRVERDEPHVGCAQADEMIAIVERAT